MTGSACPPSRAERWMVGTAQERLCPPYACTRRANQSSRQKPVQPSFKKYFAFAVGQISSTSSRRLTRQKGRIASRHERAVGCGGCDSVGRAIAGEPERALSDRPARGRTAL